MQIIFSKCIFILTLIILSLLLACGAGEEDTTLPDIPDDKTEVEQQFGTVSGIVTDSMTKNPIPGVVVTLFESEVETEVDGGFTFNDIPYTEQQVLVVSDPLYQSYTLNFVLNEIRSVKNVALTPLKDHEEELNLFLAGLSSLIESLENDNLPTLENLFSETYVAADDPITNIGLVTGVVPPNYEGVTPTFTKIFEQYSWLKFSFMDKDYDITHARKASVELLLAVDSENVDDKNLRNLEARCIFDFRREGEDWKIVYWKLLNLDIKL